MIPFCLDKLLTKLDYDIKSIEKDLIHNKYSFCNQFKKDIGLRHDAYAQDVFDFAYNLFFFKKALSEKDFKRWLEDFRDCDFKNEVKTRMLFPVIYQQMIFSYKKFFLDYLKIEHDDADYLKYKFEKNKTEFLNKLLEY